jgi:hypothetical protein
MAKAEFNERYLGDGVVWVGSSYERAAAGVKTLRAEAQDGSPNFVWRVRVVAWIKRADTVTLAAALEDLAMALGGARADLKIWNDDFTELLRTYSDCRFDGMERSEPPRESRRDFEDTVAFVFTTTEDPE